MVENARETTTVAPVDHEPVDESAKVILADLLIEEVSIDGMCGVY